MIQKCLQIPLFCAKTLTKATWKEGTLWIHVVNAGTNHHQPLKVRLAFLSLVKVFTTIASYQSQVCVLFLQLWVLLCNTVAHCIDFLFLWSPFETVSLAIRYRKRFTYNIWARVLFSDKVLSFPFQRFNFGWRTVAFLSRFAVCPVSLERWKSTSKGSHAVGHVIDVQSIR